MKATLNEKAENVKETIRGTAEKSRQTIREIIHTNVKSIGAALDSNKKIIDSIKEKLNQQEIEDTVTGTLKNGFGKSVELAEDALDSIISSFIRQMELNVDTNVKLADAVKESNSAAPEKIFNVIKENFEATRKLTINNTKELLESYNKHANLAVNFNQKFGESINAHVASLVKIQHTGLNKFNEWATEWWKQESEKEAAK